MQVYLKGTPVSTRKSPYGHDVGPQTRESVQLSLFERARQYHAGHPEGLEPAALKLKLVRTTSQLRQARGGKTVILCWVWLSDESRFRVAWLCEDLPGTLYRTWKRIPWSSIVFRSESPSVASKRVYKRRQA